MSILRGVAIGVVFLVVLGLLFVWFALPPILGGVAAVGYRVRAAEHGGGAVV